MQDLLLNRFRGALRGAVLGEAVAIDRFTWQQVRSGEWLSTTQSWPHSRSLIVAVEQTIAQALNRPIDRSVVSDWLWLPIALFFHENPILLRQQIDRLTAQSDAIEQAVILTLSEAIALALREELLLAQLLPRLSEQIAPVSPAVSNQLLQVQARLEAEASLVTIKRSISNLPRSLADLSLAVYGWLSAAEDFNLALLRMQGSPAARWVGALAGADHGIGGIAIDWWQPLTRSTAHQTWPEEVLSIDRLAYQLLAAWSGADPIDQDRSVYPAAIAAPGLIRPR